MLAMIDARPVSLGWPKGVIGRQRFIHTTVNWSVWQWLLIRTHLWEPDETMVVAGDEVVSGKRTHGLNRFFNSIYSKVVPGLGFLSLSLISVHRASFLYCWSSLISLQLSEVNRRVSQNLKAGIITRYRTESLSSTLQQNLKRLLDLT